MLVSELITILQMHNPDLPVYLYDTEPGCLQQLVLTHISPMEDRIVINPGAVRCRLTAPLHTYKERGECL